jgi:superfamily II RNA helicase
MYKDLGLLNEMKDGELQLSTYGKIVSQLTNCNEILLGRLVSNGWFNDLSAKEIGLLLALFVEEREEEYLEEEYLEVLSAPLKSMVLDIYKENKDIDEIFEGYNLDRKERLTIKFLHPMKMWLEEEEIGKIIAVYGNYDGNFVKNIYKIRDICHELGNVCETFQLGGLNEKINELEGMCIRGITEFNSLYIHHYQLVKSL